MYVHLIRQRTRRPLQSAIAYKKCTTVPYRWGAFSWFPSLSVSIHTSSSSYCYAPLRTLLTYRNLKHSHIYNNLETNQSIRSITPLEKGLEKECGKIDIYVRTSDVRRLSDFQMWQVSTTQLSEGGWQWRQRMIRNYISSRHIGLNSGWLICYLYYWGGSRRFGLRLLGYRPIHLDRVYVCTLASALILTRPTCVSESHRQRPFSLHSHWLWDPACMYVCSS